MRGGGLGGSVVEGGWDLGGDCWQGFSVCFIGC